MRLKFFLLALIVLITVAVTPVTAQVGDYVGIRVFHLAADWTPADVYRGSERIFQAVPSTNGSLISFTTPGETTFSITETGAELDSAVLEVANVTLETRHIYDLVIVGQKSDNTLHALWIDETSMLAEFDMSEGSAIFWVNNIAGTPPLTVFNDDVPIVENVAYGGMQVAFVPACSVDTERIVDADHPDHLIMPSDDRADGLGWYWEPYTVYLLGFWGTYPGEAWVDFGVAQAPFYTTAANPLQLLDSFTGHNLYINANNGVVYEFTTFLELIDEAGFTDLLSGENYYTLFAPTDHAFAQLPDGTLDTLRADPEQLRRFVQNHIVNEYITDLEQRVRITTAAGTRYTVRFDAVNYRFLLGQDILLPGFSYPAGYGHLYILENLPLLLPQS